MGFIKYIFSVFGDFLSGLIGGFIDFLIEFVENVANGLGEVIDALLSFFNGIPAFLGYLDRIIRSCFFFLPDICIDILYLGIAVVFIVLLVKFIFGLFGKS